MSDQPKRDPISAEHLEFDQLGSYRCYNPPKLLEMPSTMYPRVPESCVLVDGKLVRTRDLDSSELPNS